LREFSNRVNKYACEDYRSIAILPSNDDDHDDDDDDNNNNNNNNNKK